MINKFKCKPEEFQLHRKSRKIRQRIKTAKAKCTDTDISVTIIFNCIVNEIFRVGLDIR